MSMSMSQQQQQQQQQQQRRGHHGHHQGAAESELIRQMLRKEAQYFSGVKEHQSFLEGMAQRLTHGGTVEGLLTKQGQDSDALERLREYRETTKSLAEQTIQHERQVQAYLGGLKLLNQQLLSSASASASSQEQVPGIVDYSKAVKEAVTKAHEEIQQNAVEISQESHYIKILDELGEKAGATGAGDEEDDDIAVMMPTDGGSGLRLKCPITGVFMEKPMRNTMCKHVYEQAAIIDHLRKDKQKRCPVAGCTNRGITREQLEEDRATIQATRREKIRLAHLEKAQQASQHTIDMDDNDDDEQEME